MLSFILFKKDIGEFTGMVYETIIYWKHQADEKEYVVYLRFFFWTSFVGNLFASLSIIFAY